MTAGSTWEIDVGWGPNGLRDLAPRSDVVVVVDVLRFTTAVDVAVARGADVYPYRWHDGSEADYAGRIGAELAVPGYDVGRDHPWSLSPFDLSTIPTGTRLVLPSPNDAALAFAALAAGAGALVAACLRNAPAVAAWLAERRGRIGLLAAGERWRGATGPLRPAVEDWLGVGAVAHALDPAGLVSSPDAAAAAGGFAAVADRLQWALERCPSGRELIDKGLGRDLAPSARHGVSSSVPVLVEDRFLDGSSVAAPVGE
jgi:2-phosphosulfolactate phosphatase